MSGFLGLLAGANNAYKKEQQAKSFQDVLLQQKQAQADLQGQLIQSQIGENNAQTDAIRNPKPKPAMGPVEGSPEWLALQEKLEQIKAKYRPQPARNIDPLSREGIAAQEQVNASKPKPEPKEPSESEKRAAGLLNEIEPAAEAVKKYSPKLSGVEAYLPSGIANVATRNQPERQQALQAAQDLVATYLYAVSGATVQANELKARAQLILPNFNDSDAVKKQKNATIDRMVETVRTIAGRAYKPSEPSAPQTPVNQGHPAKSGDINLGGTKTPVVSDEEFNAILGKYKK